MAHRTSGLVLRLQRVLPAPQAVVFRALTEAVELATWWGPRGFTIPELDFEAQVGRAYRIAMQPPDGDRFLLEGEFREVDPPHRLAFTFRWDPPDPDDRETLATLTLLDRDDTTEVTLTQRAFATESRRALHEAGGTESFDRLEEMLRP